MKSKSISLYLALLALVGAGLRDVNTRLNNPPLTQADKKFRVFVAGADSIEASQMSCSCRPVACAADAPIYFKPLNAAQTRALIEKLRLVKVSSTFGAPISTDSVTLNLKFRRKGREPLSFTLSQTPSKSNLTQFNSTGGPTATYRL